MRTRIAALLVATTSVGTSVSACGSDEPPRIMWVEGRSDSSTIDVRVGTCGRDGLVIGVVSETPAEIQLRARADGGDNGGECAQGQRVHLAEPLGDRRVVDADTFDEIEVRP